jgi:succinate-semialdehyde dehydrogenase/glutarate-semialdehyde dehydrogenase
MHEARLYIDGEWVDGERRTPVLDKFTEQPAAELHHASAAQVAAATRAVAAAQREHTLTPYERYTVLSRASELLAERADAFVRTLVEEGGFTLSDSAREVERGGQTLLLSAEEAKRIHGEVVPLNGAPGGNGRLAFTVRRPVGVVCASTPFYAPVNTGLHKVAPAIAAGNGVVLKPSTYTPVTSELIVRLLLDAGLPAGLIALVHGGGDGAASHLLADPVPSFYAFTGSTEVGRVIRGAIGLRRAQLEMGSLSSTIVCEDAELEACVTRCVSAGFRKAGQICTSIQRLYVHEAVLDDVVDALAAALDGREAGDPRDPGSFIGPVISRASAERIETWIRRAQDGGATIVRGGTRHGTVVAPTVLTDVPPDAEIMTREVFGPVVAIRPFESLDAVIDEANATPFGLAAGIFTRDIGAALTAAERLEMGSVHINETSNSRVDLMPYSGAKASGVGREGPRYAIEEMTEERLITISRP